MRVVIERGRIVAVEIQVRGAVGAVRKRDHIGLQLFNRERGTAMRSQAPGV